MRAQIRTVNKIGKGKYFTTSWKVSDYIIFNVLYFMFFYVPIKCGITKFINLIKNKKE